jgi:hypothetical protein
MIQPNGARILDQMGIYERLAEEGKMAINTIRRTDGRVVSANEWPRLIAR